MQVKNEAAIPASIQNEKPLVLKEGEQLQATVKGKLAENEAILRMKGQEVRVRFEGTLPANGKIMIQVMDTSKEIPYVKEIKSPVQQTTQPKVSSPSFEGFYLQQGVKADLRKAVDILIAKGQPVTKSTLQELAIFIEKGEGTIEQKLETVSAMAKKGLEFTPVQIKAVHRALHDSSFKDHVHDLINEISPEKLKPQSPADTGQIIRANSNDAASPINSLSGEGATALANIEQLIKALKKEPDISQIFAMLKEQLATPGALTSTQTEKLQAALEKAISMTESGRELASRQILMGTLESIKKEQSNVMQSQPVAETYALTDEFIATLPVQSKNYIVSTVTKKLSQLTIDFKNIKRDIMRNLQNVQVLLSQNQSQAKSMLETTIKLLDQTILKSDVMLHMDMGTEKRLMQASSQLAEARKLLSKGDLEQAGKIVREVQTVVEKLVFKPSETRIQHFVSEKLFEMEQSASKQQHTQMLGSSLQAVKDSSSGRQVFELLRNMGLTYEADKAYALISKGNTEEVAASLKEVLLRLSRSNAETSLSQKAEQLVTSITGQQLLSKADTASLQSMMFVLPFLLKEQVEQVKVFVNSKSKQQKVDWENCSLYFLLETKKLGEVGILLSSVDRNLSVTLKNDRLDFQKKIAPLAEKAKERLQEIGYHIGTIQFARLSDEEKTEEPIKPAVKPILPHLTERGYDFSV